MSKKKAAVVHLENDLDRDLWVRFQKIAISKGINASSYALNLFEKEIAKEETKGVFLFEKEAVQELEKMGYTIRHRVGRWMRLGKLENIGFTNGKKIVYDFKKLVDFIEKNPKMLGHTRVKLATAAGDQ